jgi:hypothetical protein
MTASFADYVATQGARQQITDKVQKHTQELCDALKQNYINSSIKRHEWALQTLPEDQFSVNYHQKCIDELKNGICDYDFFYVTGRKYHKIIMSTQSDRSAHAFVDVKTGEVYMAASWKSPAKHVRYNLLLIKDREWLMKKADWCGQYLCMNSAYYKGH